jgi:hypothetical protein
MVLSSINTIQIYRFPFQQWQMMLFPTIHSIECVVLYALHAQEMEAAGGQRLVVLNYVVSLLG